MAASLEQYRQDDRKPIIGGAAQVFRARDTQTGERVALKIPLPSDERGAERLLREAKIYKHLGKINGLVEYRDHAPDGSFLALEWLNGRSLSEYARFKPASERWVVSLGRAVCKVLRQLHQRGVIHGDLSPANVFLLEGSQEVRLIDLGLATAPSIPPVSEKRAGTPGLLAPEVGDVRADERSDIFALGAVMERALTGAFRGSSKMPLISRGLRAILERCGSPEPDERYQSIAELERALDALSRVQRVVRPSVGGGVLLVVAAAWLGWWASMPPPQVPREEVQPETDRPFPPSEPVKEAPTSAPVWVKEISRVLSPVPAPSPALELLKKPRRGRAEALDKNEMVTPPSEGTGASEDDMSISPETLAWGRKIASQPRTILVPPSRIVLNPKTK